MHYFSLNFSHQNGFHMSDVSGKKIQMQVFFNWWLSVQDILHGLASYMRYEILLALKKEV